MSELASVQRRANARWARPGGSHDRVITLWRVVLPIGAGVVAALMVSMPLTTTSEVSFVLDRNKVAVAPERMKLESAAYRGQDDKGRPFLLTAGQALQRSSKDPNVQINNMTARLELNDGPASIDAPRGSYNLDEQKMRVDGPIKFAGPRNYNLDANGATVDLRTKRMTSEAGGVTGSLPQGTFSGDKLSADLDQRSVTLDGRARLRIIPGRAK